MARRMFSLKITDTDAFLDMSLSAQALYFHLAMRADDDGFVANPRKIMRMLGSQEDDYKILSVKKFIIPFESGVCVIKHWLIHNLIRADRYTETQWMREKKQLVVDEETGKYSLVKPKFDVIPNGNQVATQYRLGKGRLGKGRKEREVVFTPPSLQEVSNYCLERKNKINAQQFIDFYSSKGWLIGKNKMKDWRAAVRTWEGREQEELNKPNYVKIR